MTTDLHELERLSRELGGARSALDERLGIEYLVGTAERVVARMPVAGNTQVYGTLHGGASCVLAEAIGSCVAAIHAGPGRMAVGIELNASHHRPVGAGHITGTATVAHAGATLVTSDVVITDEQGRRVCTARVTSMLRDRPPGAVAGAAEGAPAATDVADPDSGATGGPGPDPDPEPGATGGPGPGAAAGPGAGTERKARGQGAETTAVVELPAARGAARIPHPGGTLPAHLERVHALLEEWQARPALRLAGLCHAFYGTDGFPEALGDVATGRDDLAALIGEEAEGLVHFYGGCDRRFSHPHLADPEGAFKDRFTGTVSRPPLAPRRDFAELTAANELDIVRINPGVSAAHGAGLRRLLTSWRQLLSDPAWQAVQTTLP